MKCRNSPSSFSISPRHHLHRKTDWIASSSRPQSIPQPQCTSTLRGSPMSDSMCFFFNIEMMIANNPHHILHSCLPHNVRKELLLGEVSRLLNLTLAFISLNNVHRQLRCISYASVHHHPLSSIAMGIVFSGRSCAVVGSRDDRQHCAVRFFVPGFRSVDQATSRDNRSSRLVDGGCKSRFHCKREESEAFDLFSGSPSGR